MRKSLLFLLILGAAGLVGLGFALTQINAKAQWRAYAKKAYFEACKKDIEEYYAGFDPVSLSDKLRECNIVAQERW